MLFVRAICVTLPLLAAGLPCVAQTAPAGKPPPAGAEAASRPGAPASKAAKPEANAGASPIPAASRPAPAPQLDLASLEKRLKESAAIGVFTKLTLKNQVDDLLGRFRAMYQGSVKTTLADLREPYDLLILKVITLLQDDDPSLARAIRESREAIWGILSDPARFSKYPG